MSKFEDLKNAVAAAEEDHTKFEAGNKAAGTRLRKAMLEIKNIAQAIRVEVQDVKNAG